MAECPCFYFNEAALDGDVLFCECGHTDDEHDEDGDCGVELDDEDSVA